jgi:hypothetical protein
MSSVKKTARKTSKKPVRKAAAGTPKPRPAAKKAAPARPAPKKKAAVATAPKKAAPPAPVPKKAPAPPAVPVKKGAAAPAPPVPETRPRPPSRPKELKKPAAKQRPRAPIVPDIIKPGLGGRWECYGCGSKFYDLGKPDPICPKCGADQREKPREKPSPPTPQPEKPRRAAVPMGSLLDEDEEPIEEFEAEEGDLAGIDAEAFLSESPDEEEEEVDVTTIEED